MVLTNEQKAYTLTLKMSEDEIKEVVRVLDGHCDYGAGKDLACLLRTVLKTSASSKCENEDV